MTKLRQLHDRYGQSPWLDNLTRGDLVGGRLRRLVDQGIQGVTSNPTIIAKAISGSADYDRQLATLAAQGHDAEASYWSLVADDLNGALAVLRPVDDRSGGGDGSVSVELAPALAHDPDTITTLPEPTIAAFEDRGTLATTITRGVQDAQATLERLAAVGIDLGQTADVLEAEGVAAFANSYDELLALLQARADSSWQVLEGTGQPGARSGTGRDAPASVRTRS
jgi:transaldolase